jgi:hypothetical protein
VSRVGDDGTTAPPVPFKTHANPITKRDALAEEVRNWKHEAESAKFDERAALAARAERDALAERLEACEGENDTLEAHVAKLEKALREIHDHADTLVEARRIARRALEEK